MILPPSFTRFFNKTPEQKRTLNEPTIVLYPFYQYDHQKISPHTPATRFFNKTGSEIQLQMVAAIIYSGGFIEETSTFVVGGLAVHSLAQQLQNTSWLVTYVWVGKSVGVQHFLPMLG